MEKVANFQGLRHSLQIERKVILSAWRENLKPSIKLAHSRARSVRFVQKPALAGSKD